MAAFPTVHDTLNGRRGTVIDADADGVTVVWVGSMCVHYTAVDVASGRFLFTIPRD